MKTGKNTTIFYRLAYPIISIAFFTALFWGWTECSDPETSISSKQIVEPQVNAFGFCSDSLDQQSFLVQRNETLSDILLNFDLPGDSIIRIVNRSRDVLDVRKIIAGNTYHTFTKEDSLNSLAYIVYEKSPVNFIVFDLNDSLNVYESAKEISIRENQKSAVINNSLYVSLIQSDASPDLAIKLSQIFAWQIDFYHLQEGDNFKVIYEEM